MTCCPNQVGHEPSAATIRINIIWDRTLFYTAFCTKIKFFMILEVLEAKGTFLQWKTISGHRGKWKCEDIYLSLILAPVIAKQLDQLPLEIDEGMRCRHRRTTFEGIFDPCAILTGPSCELLLPRHLNRPESHQWSRCHFKTFVWKFFTEWKCCQLDSYQTMRTLSSVHLVVHQPPPSPPKTSWGCWRRSFPPPPSPDHPLKVHGGLASWSSPR